MAYDNLADFLEVLEDAGELVRITAGVEAELEIAEITRRVAHSAGPALWFQNVAGHDTAVVTNLLGSESRVCRALSIDSLEELSCRAAELLKPPLDATWLERLRNTPSSNPWASAVPKMVASAVCQQVVKLGRDVNLAALPIKKSWPQDAAAVLTAGQAFTRRRGTHQRNVGLYPLQVIEPRRLAIGWEAHQGGRRHYEEFRAAGEKMPLAVALGGDPICSYMAAAPLPAGADECLLGGLLRGRPLELVKCRTIDLEVPATAEMVIEGYVDPAEPDVEMGPFGAATGFYTAARQAPSLYVTAVTHRTSPVLPAIVTGRPPHELCTYSRVTRALFLPAVRMIVPELVDFELPDFGAVQRFLFLAIEKTYPHQAQKAAAALLGLGPFIGTKAVVIVDADVKLRDADEVWYRVASHVHPPRDVTFMPMPTDRLDHAAPVPSAGQAMIIDATCKLPDEHPRPWPDAAKTSDEIREQVSRRLEEFGLGSVMEDT